MRPVSSGSRSASSAARGNSGSSSRNSTPPWASEISPGRGGEPPPTSADRDWRCGAARAPAAGRNAAGSKPARPGPAARRWPAPRPASIGGSRPARRCASIDLPVPGGPIISRLWPPAAAISSARLAAAWPLTSRRSGRRRAAAPLRRRGARQRHGAHRPAAARAPPRSRCRRARTSQPVDQRGLAALSPRQHQRARRPARRSASASASAPRTGRSSPASDSSPANSKRVQPRRVDLPARGQDAQRDRQVEAARLLGQVGRRQVDGDALVVREGEAAVAAARRARARATSFTSVSARPTSVKLGRPLARCTSTVHRRARPGRRARGCGRRQATWLAIMPAPDAARGRSHASAALCTAACDGRTTLVRAPMPVQPWCTESAQWHGSSAVSGVGVDSCRAVWHPSSNPRSPPS